MTKSQSNRQTSGASHAATTLGHPPQSAVRPNASQVLSRLRDTLFAAADANLSKSFVISASHASNLPPELHALLASLPDFKAPFHPFSQPGGATIALWTTLCDPEMLKVFGKAALDAASRARDCVSSAEGVLREQAEGGVSRKRSDLWAAAMAFARTDSWGVWKDWKWWIAGVADFAFTVSQHPQSHQTAFLLFPLIFDFYLEDPLGLDRSAPHVPVYRAALADYARGFCQVFAMKGPRDEPDKKDPVPWKDMIQRTIDRLQEPAIAPDNLSPTAIPTLHLDFARMLVRLRDWEAATAQLDMISAVESLKDQVAALRAQIEAKDEGVDEVNGGPRTVAVDEEGTTIALDANAAKKFAEAGQAAQCGFPGCPTRSRPDVSVVVQRCSRCQSVSYCGKPCQEKHWKVHKAECKAPK